MEAAHTHCSSLPRALYSFSLHGPLLITNIEAQHCAWSILRCAETPSRKNAPSCLTHRQPTVSSCSALREGTACDGHVCHRMCTRRSW
jgi:hypothetical protein